MAKNKMGSCMSEWKDKHPHGRAKKAMTNKKAHKQAVAACLNKTGINEVFAQPSGHGKSSYAQRQRQCPVCKKGIDKADMMKKNGKEMCKSCARSTVKEGMSFKEFVTENEGMTTRDYIRSLPMYGELMKDPQAKPQMMALARGFVQEFGDQPVTGQIQSYIADEVDDLYRNLTKQGSNIGDWKGEEEYQRRKGEEQDIESAMDKWEQTTGMDAVTGASKHDARGRLMHGARSGQDFRDQIKSKRAAQDLLGQGNVGGEANRAQLQQRAASAPAGEFAYQGGESKADRAFGIVRDMLADHRPAEIKARLRDELNMSGPGANTYFYKMKKRALAEQQ